MQREIYGAEGQLSFRLASDNKYVICRNYQNDDINCNYFYSRFNVTRPSILLLFLFYLAIFEGKYDSTLFDYTITSVHSVDFCGISTKCEKRVNGIQIQALVLSVHLHTKFRTI